MEQVAAFGPPPLPPKTRRSPPDSATVLSSSTADVFGYTVPEVHTGHSQICSTGTTSGNHVVKIRINPEDASVNSTGDAGVVCEISPCIRISVNSNETEMIQNNITESANSNAYFYYNPFNCGTVISSGQVSPSDTLDSGTCSDLDSTPPPPLPKKKSAGVSVTVIGAQHKRAPSLTSSGADADSDDNESNISCDSLNSGDLPEELSDDKFVKECKASAFLPQGLLKDIRDRSIKLTQTEKIEQHDDLGGMKPEKQITESLNNNNKKIIEECIYEERDQKPAEAPTNIIYDTDKFYKFHLNEHLDDEENVKVTNLNTQGDESFAGYKDLLGEDGASTIRSARGTVRGVKNRVRAGIATFLQINDYAKSYKEKDAGKVVVYATTMGIVRETHHACMKVKQIMRTLLVKFEERDVFMSTEYQAEIRDRMRCDHILVPQVFVDGQHIGDAETIERLNETGELRRILKPYKSMDACTTCKSCGGFRLLPCPVCNGSKKSLHRNHFTAEFVALKCMNCDEVGLVKCSSCS